MNNITPNYRTVQDLLANRSFTIDEYQREYKWSKENVDELITDLYEKFVSCFRPGDGIKAIKSYEDYFLGSIIITDRNGSSCLIDGQQRVTTLTLFLIYLYNAAAEKELKVAETIAPMIYSDNLGDPQFNLDIPERKVVLETLFKNKAERPNDNDESVQNMYLRYADIQSRDLAGELDDALPHFIYWLMRKVGLIEISTDNDNYAYAIFETMNDRGKPLSPVDMLKAYLLAPIKDEDQRRSANQIWRQQILNLISWGGQVEQERDSSCIKAWLRSQYATSIRERKPGSIDRDWELIGSSFHRWARENQARLNIGTEDQNIRLIKRKFPFFAEAYRSILDAGKVYQRGLEAVFYNANNEFTWQNTVLLAPLCETDDPETVRKKISAVATYLDIWLMRRTINYIRVGYSTTSYTMYNLCVDIRNKSLPDLVGFLFEKLNNDDVTFEGSQVRSRYGMNDLTVNLFTRRYIFHLLARITSFIEANSGRPDLFEKYVDRSVKNPYDIEHIWADNYEPFKSVYTSEADFQNNRNHVAGLLLLPADVNRSLQDKPYKDKLATYRGQNLYAASLDSGAYQGQPQFRNFIARYGLPFEPYAEYGKTEQNRRKELILKLVNLIWSPERICGVLE